MNRRPMIFGYVSILLGVSSAASAGEFTLYDPGISPNIKLVCDAKHYVDGAWQTSHPFKLHLDVFFEEKYALLSDGNAPNDVRMDLTSVVPTDKNRQEYIVLNRGTATAIINMEHHDIIVSDYAAKEVGNSSISGRECQMDTQG